MQRRSTGGYATAGCILALLVEAVVFYSPVLFSKKLGYRPASQTFVAGPEWTQITLPFSRFGDVDGSDIMAIVWAAGPKTGKFVLELDSIRLE